VDSGRTGRALHLDLPAVAESCPHVREALRAALAGTAVDTAAVDLAVTEAVTNVVVHAYRDRPPADEPGRVHVTLDLDDAGASVLVADEGVGMTPRVDTPGLGLGLSLIANLCDKLSVEQRADGTSVQMRFAFASDDSASEKER